MPFEINRVTIEPDGFKVTFTKPVDQVTGRSTDSWVISAFTHPYHGAYGGPEIEQQKPGVKAVSLAEDGLSARITLEKLDQGFVYEFDLARLRSCDNEELLHRKAFYTVNEILSRYGSHSLREPAGVSAPSGVDDEFAMMLGKHVSTSLSAFAWALFERPDRHPETPWAHR